MRMPFVIWFAAWDVEYVADPSPDFLRHIGLRTEDDTEKPAWRVWADTARRPYAPP